MVKVFGVGMTVHFSLKNVGLNDGFLDYFSDNLELNFETVFEQSWAKFLGLFWAVPRLVFGLSMCTVL